MEFQQTQSRIKILPCDILHKQVETIGTDIFTFNDIHFLDIVDYHSQFPVVKQVDGLSAEQLIRSCKSMSTKYGPPCKIVWSGGSNFFWINVSNFEGSSI